ncbi:MAG: hypothetical protein KKE51_06455 [Gammaproteobacteria bacterium]|nr:hypothetical protein [Gammaproteobacteria bacterium]MBU2435866.1 hypothetical protein [Gammaproteobacteria bacterium]MBU2449353.1 hypothetical protein [Gammaproteobacteria bacterium]
MSENNQKLGQRLDGQESPDAMSSANASARRKLIKAGLTPVVLTLASRPVLAWHCKSPSAYGSANLSNHTHSEWGDEGTKQISYWQNNLWPSPYVKNSTTMGAIFGTGSSTLAKHRLSSGTPLEKYLIAAALNIQLQANSGLRDTNGDKCLLLQDIRDMYVVVSGGTYHPSAGIDWDATKIITYLQENWIVTG